MEEQLRPTYSEISLRAIAARGPEFFSSLSYIKSFWELLDRRGHQAASERAWKQQVLLHWQQTPEEPFKPVPLVQRPCPSIVEHTFANGDRTGRCRGTHRMPDGRIVPCTFAFGMENLSLNNRKHGPDLFTTADSVDEDHVEQEVAVEELLAGPTVEAGVDDIKVVIDPETGEEFEVAAEGDEETEGESEEFPH